MCSFAETHRTVLSLISCFAGGVFLAACLLDIIPDYLSDIHAELDARMVEVRLSMDCMSELFLFYYFYCKSIM